MQALLNKYAQDGRVTVKSLGDDNPFWKIARALMPKSYPDGVTGCTTSISLQHQFLYPILALDPGETTGLALWDPSSKQVLMCQLETKSLEEGFDKLHAIINYLSLDNPSMRHVRYEDYRVYGHMTEQHAFASLHTAKLIGCIVAACHLAQVTSSCALAIHAKTFFTDEKLRMFGMYAPGMKHSRDAVRHLLRHISEGIIHA